MLSYIAAYIFASWDTYIWIIVNWSSPSYPNQFTGIASVSPKAPRLRDIVSHVRKYIHRGLFYWVHSWIYCGMLGYINIEISRTDAATVRRILCWSSVELWHCLDMLSGTTLLQGLMGHNNELWSCIRRFRTTMQTGSVNVFPILGTHSLSRQGGTEMLGEIPELSCRWVLQYCMYYDPSTVRVLLGKGWFVN